MSDRPTTAAQAIEWANHDASYRRCHWYTSSCGRVELALTYDDAESASHPGECDADIAELARVPYIAEQLATIPAEVARDVATESGRNDYGHGPGDNFDHAANLAWILWQACGDITEGERS